MYNREIASPKMAQMVLAKMDELEKACGRRIDDGKEYAVHVPFIGEIPKKITNNITVDFFEIDYDTIVLWLKND